MPTFGSLFSGIGGIDLGLERAGWTCEWQVEIDEFCRKVLTKHWPDVPKFGDVKNVRGNELRPVDLICGGFPCQPVSYAGKQLAQADERWLWPEFARLIRILRPRYILVENVPGLYKWGIGDVLGDLAACGYDAEWDCLPASAFGAPHERQRVWIVGYTRGWYDSVFHKHQQRITTNANSERCEEQWWPEPIFTRQSPIKRDSWWETEPGMGRVANGLSYQVDRNRSLGNSVVPQVVEWIGKRILAHMGEIDAMSSMSE
jgi:DNA (cytosine-5)-methyltransferase 1